MVGSFEQRLSSKKGYISRKIMPVVVLSGSNAKSALISKIPVPSGFILLIEDDNLMFGNIKQIRNGIDGFQPGHPVGNLAKNTRGLYTWACCIWYQDALGLTKISVATAAKAILKACPDSVL